MPDGTFDLVELKYDGMFATAECADGAIVIRGRNGRIKACLATSTPLRAKLVGEYLYGTAWAKRTGRTGQLWAFDVIEVDGKDVSQRPLANRRMLLNNLTLPAGFHIAPQYPAHEWQRLWSDLVEPGDFEGLVFKSSRDRYGEPWARMKRRVTCDYVCMGTTPGSGRYAGQAASLIGGLHVKGHLTAVIRVPGLTNEQRVEYAIHPERIVGRVFEATGYDLFPSGALRHPAFGRWREDKASEECKRAA